MSGGWNTIESDAGVFTYLLESLGVKGVQFEELISLDPSMLAQLQPVYGVIFLFKYPTDQPYTSSSGPQDGTYDHSAAESMFFAHQTIQNACATQALLSVLLNKTDAIDIGDALRSFRDFTISLPPEYRGDSLSNSDLIRSVHNSFARASPFVDETQQPRAGAADDAFHFVAYTVHANALYELDGLQPAPISHGACDQAAFPARVVDVLQRRVARYEDSEIRFNLLAMVADQRVRAREFGDAEMLAREEQKRKDWLFENSLRRHNFVGFAGEVAKMVVKDKEEKGQFREWVDQSLQRMKNQEAMYRRAAGQDAEMSG
ncbi:hypothetical protein TD95_003637 [Thielaviopsis punctulata]|uniref:Ubiquitin carboxyl-terminal hydrolase n=1 Tax=Thielaviopsis punctulata TaxID=72032 RepID=A0A0F4ZIT9_9PEZI|nr:hypothetical protein TD95_003637 [Thielaviopsis punctulata]